GGGQRGLRDPAAAGCAGEVELLAQRQEVVDLLHLHDYRLPFAEARKRHSPGHLRRWLQWPVLLHAEPVTGRPAGPWVRPESFLIELRPLSAWGHSRPGRSNSPAHPRGTPAPRP